MSLMDGPLRIGYRTTGRDKVTILVSTPLFRVSNRPKAKAVYKVFRVISTSDSGGEKKQEKCRDKAMHVTRLILVKTFEHRDYDVTSSVARELLYFSIFPTPERNGKKCDDIFLTPKM
jgi:hypothetical protein